MSNLCIAYVGGSTHTEPKTAFRYALLFAAGMAVTVTSLGVFAVLLGKLFN